MSPYAKRTAYRGRPTVGFKGGFRSHDIEVDGGMQAAYALAATGEGDVFCHNRPYNEEPARPALAEGEARQLDPALTLSFALARRGR